MLKTMNVAADDVRKQVQRISCAESFRFSEVQRRLLAYLAEKSLSGDADQVKEYTLAIDALGRPESYDPRHDSSVRLQTAKLRQKIQEYYRTEGRSDPVLVDFPKGRFKLVFSYRESALPAPEQSGWGWRRMALIAWAALTLGLTFLCIYWRVGLARLERETGTAVEERSPALEEFWRPFSRKDRTLVCIGAPLFIRLPKTGFLRDSFVNTWEAAVSAGFAAKLQRAFPGEEPAPWYEFTGTGEAGAAFLLARLLSTQGFRLNFTDSAQLTWNEVGENDVVFVGPPKFIPQINDLPSARDLVQEDEGIRNLKPRPGEPAYLRDEYTNAAETKGKAYALISRLPGLHAKGEILALGGTWTEGTLAAAQYVTLETHMRDLLGRLRLPSGKLPAYFQVVISATVHRSTPVEISYVLHHVLTPAARLPAANAAGQAGN